MLVCAKNCDAFINAICVKVIEYLLKPFLLVFLSLVIPMSIT